MTTLTIPSCDRNARSRDAQVPQWRVVLALGLAWYGVFALMLFGQALGLL